MIDGYKIIGLCITKINDESCTEFTQQLSLEAIAAGYRVFVYNSFRDFYYKDEYDDGARSIYQAVNFDILDALVVDYRSFYNHSIIEDLIDRAKMHGLPVVVLNKERDDCFCIVNNYDDVYKELIRHIIRDHGARAINFIAGAKNESNSQRRLKCYKEVLVEFNIPFDEERVGYGNYWSVPVHEVIDRWVASDRPMPDAIICVNDASAVDACERLAYYGYHAPDDFIITGFDGIQSATFHTPQLTTCCKDNASFAKSCMKLIRMGIEENCCPCTVSKKYSIILSESCGCPLPKSRSFREQASKLYHNIIEFQMHENALYSWADKIAESTDLAGIGENLHDNILPGSSICLNNNFLSSIRMGEKTNPNAPFANKMIAITTKETNLRSASQELFPLSDMYPQIEKYISEPVMFVFQSIYVGNRVCGYYALRTGSLVESAHKIHRLCRIINISFGTLVSRLEQSHMISRMEDMQYRDIYTELLNLKGLNKKLEEIADFARTKRIAVSIYSIARYKYIYENYGIKDIEEAVSLVSESLQIANTSNSILARIADDEFAVINLEDDEVDIGAIINNSVAIFFANMETYNVNHDKGYFIEVNCGCTVAEPGWTETLETYLKVASSEMYLNRIKFGTLPALKDEKRSTKDSYRLFEVLIEKNLFVYNFQPIVDAKTGDIYAYEALMRTYGEVNMNPGEVLQVATDYRRLDDVEYATFSNVLSFADKNPEKFEGKRIFINTIPGHFLKQEAYNRFSEEYSHVLKNCVIEITEQGETTDEELNQIRDFGGKNSGCQLAIDDYGSGTSNIVNLLRYNPNVIKIDRFLLTEIQNDVNKQMFVKNVIDFAKVNGIKTIAEGVETKEELFAVISYGADLIQGFYTARPSADPLQKLPDNIINDIIEANKAAGK